MNGGSVNAFDYDTGAHIGGTLSNLYHYGEGCHIQIKMNGDRFTGYDYGCGQSFSGSLNGNSVSLYDYQTGQYYSYS